jgi:hypothetical protein
MDSSYPSGGDRLGRIERKSGDVTDRTCSVAVLIAGTACAASSITLKLCFPAIPKIGSMSRGSRYINQSNRLCLGRNRDFDLRRIQIERIALAIHHDWFTADGLLVKRKELLKQRRQQQRWLILITSK